MRKQQSGPTGRYFIKRRSFNGRVSLEGAASSALPAASYLYSDAKSAESPELAPLIVDTEDLLPADATEQTELQHHTRLARKHTAAVAELAEVDPQQAYEFFEWLATYGTEQMLANEAAAGGKARELDDVAQLRALVQAMRGIVVAAMEWECGEHYTAATLIKLIQEHRSRVAAALAGVVVRDEREEMAAWLDRRADSLDTSNFAHSSNVEQHRIALQNAARDLRSSAPPQDKGRQP